MRKINEIEKQNLRAKAKAELERINRIEDDIEMAQRIEAFKSKFSKCEIVYKVILETHQLYMKGVRPVRMKIHMTQVKSALSFAGYDFDEILLGKIFGSEDRVGSRSAKTLRDLLTHKMSTSACDELNNRWDELNNNMDLFLNKIESFDG